MVGRDLLIQLIVKAIGTAAASADIEGLDDKLAALASTLSRSEFVAAGDDLRAFGDAVKSATDPLAQATAKTLAFQTAIAGLASALANRAYQSAKDYESALADLAKVIDGGMDAAKSYAARLNETASQFARNGQELVTAMANFVQAGYDAEAAFGLVTESTKLMIAGELDAAESSALLVSILKGFKAPASEAAATVDLLNDVSNKYATDVKQLAIGMAAVSPIAKQMGFSMAETAGLLTPIIEVYRSGSEAADALKTSLQQLSANTVPVKTALASIGVSQTDLNGKMRGGKDIFLDVARAFIGLSDAQKAYFTQELVGIEQAGRFGQVINSLGQYLRIAADDAGRAGSAMREVEARLDTAEATAKRADESFRQLAVTLGNAFKPQIRGVVDATGELAAAFDRSIKAGDLSPLLNAIKPQIASIETLFRAMASNLEAALSGVDWRPLVDGLKAVSGELGDAFGKLTEGMDLSTAEGLKNLLQALINLLGNFSQFVAGAVDGLEPLLGALNTLFGAVSQNSPELAKLAGEISGLATSANQLVPAISAFGSAIFGAIGNIADLALKIGLLVAALRLLSAAGIPVLGILGRLAGAFLALNPAVASAAAALAGFPGIVTALVAGAGTLGYGIGTLINQFVEWATGGRSVGSMLADLVDAVTGVNEEITRGATAEELAIARANRLAREKKAQAEATRKAAEAEKEAREKSDANLKAQEEKLKLAAAEEETAKRLEAQYAKLGLVYDRMTGQILRQGEASAKQRQEARELGDALDKLGVKANFMADRITAGGKETIATFRSITQNAQATAAQIEAAFKGAIASAETEAEVKKILEAYKEWAAGAKKGSADVAGATKQADDALKTLRKSTEETSLASRLYAAAGVDALEIKRLESLAAGDLATALKIEKEQREKAAAAAKNQAAAGEDQAAAAERQAQASKDQAAAIAETEREARRAAPIMAYLAESFGELNEKGRAALDAISGDALLRGAGNATALASATAEMTRKLDDAAQAELAFAGEIGALQQTAAGVGEEADRARQKLVEMALYGAQGIDGITGAGENAVRALEDIKRASLEAEDALSGMAADFRKQILQIQGDQKALLDLEYQDNLRKLEELSAKAGELGREEYERAKADAEDLHRLKLKQLKEQEEARRQTTATAPTGGGSSGGSGGTTTVNNTFLIDPTKLANEEWVRRNVIPTVEKVSRLRG